MRHHNRRRGQSSAYRAATLSKANGRVTIEAAAVIIFGTTGATALCATAILLSAALANIALQSDLYRVGVAFGEIQHVTVALVVVFCQGTKEDSRNLYRNTGIP